MKLKTLDADTSLVDIVGEVNSDNVLAFSFTSYRLAAVLFDN